MLAGAQATGSLFVNLGDKRSGSGGHNISNLAGTSRNSAQRWCDTCERHVSRTSCQRCGATNLRIPADIVPAVPATRRNAPDRYNQAAFGRPKSKMLLPHRFAIGCEDGLADPDGVGWIVRQDIVWCLSGGVRVYARTPTGVRPVMLRDLIRAHQPEDVQLWNGERWTQVLGWNETPRPDDALEVELRSGQRIGCTRNHQWPTARGLVEAGDLRVGDVIETCRLPEPDWPRKPSGLPDADTGWFVGLYMAEGSRSGKMIQFAGHLEERTRLERLRRIAAAYDGQANVYQTSPAGATINLSGAVLAAILTRYISGTSAKDKRLRFTVWQRSDEFLSGILAGYLEGDGHFDAKNQRWRLGFTNNDEWANDLRTLCARLGLPLRLARSTVHAFGKDWPAWKGDLRLERSPHPNARKDGEVVAIRASRARHFYDLGVADEPHLFALASGVLTHNSKPNGLPESVTDRVRDSHEYWFMLNKQGRYFSAVDEVREPHAEGAWDKGPRSSYKPGSASGSIGADGEHERKGDAGLPLNPLGKLPGSVWQIPSEPLTLPDAVKAHYDLPDHFAAFPSEWPRRLILGWSPSGVCVACGEGRRPVVAKSLGSVQATNNASKTSRNSDNGWAHEDTPRGSTEATITGYACACPDTSAPTRKAVVVDVFGGTGTVAGVARQLGRFGLSFDLSFDYCRLAAYFLRDGKRFAKSASRTDAERQGTLL